MKFRLQTRYFHSIFWVIMLINTSNCSKFIILTDIRMKRDGKNSQCFPWGLMGYAVRSLLRTACMVNYVVVFYIAAINYHACYSAYGGIYMVDRSHPNMYMFKTVQSFASLIRFTKFPIRCGHILRQVWKIALQHYVWLKINIGR